MRSNVRNGSIPDIPHQLILSQLLVPIREIEANGTTAIHLRLTAFIWRSIRGSDPAAGQLGDNRMRGAAKLAVGLATLLAVGPAHAATIVVFKNPETLEQRMVVLDPNGPDRVIMCMLPPGEAGCHQLKATRAP